MLYEVITKVISKAEIEEIVAKIARIPPRSVSSDDRGALANRITSYNVCYTKLLRVLYQGRSPTTARRSTTCPQCLTKRRSS